MVLTVLVSTSGLMVSGALASKGTRKYYFEGVNTLVEIANPRVLIRKCRRLLGTQTGMKSATSSRTKERDEYKSNTGCFTARSEGGRKMGGREDDKPMGAVR